MQEKLLQNWEKKSGERQKEYKKSTRIEAVSDCCTCDDREKPVSCGLNKVCFHECIVALYL